MKRRGKKEIIEEWEEFRERKKVQEIRKSGNKTKRRKGMKESNEKRRNGRK